MMSKKKQRQEDLPALGQMMSWVDKPGSLSIIIKALIILCIGLVLADFTYDKHGHFDMEHYPGFYAVFGFIAFGIIVLAAKALRTLIKQPEDYYSPYAVDAEEMPTSQTEEETNDGK